MSRGTVPELVAMRALRGKLLRLAAVAAITLASLTTLAEPGVAAAGRLDPSFSDNGWHRTLMVTGPSGNFFPAGAEDIAVQRDGKVVAVGELQNAQSHWYWGVFRYTPGGRLDTTFSGDGWIAHSFGSFPMPHAVALQPDGKIVVGGSSICAGYRCFTLVRYHPNGTIDKTFGGGDGIARTRMQITAGINDIAVQADGKIVAVGHRMAGGDAQDDEWMAIARYLPDGRLDRSFSGDGKRVFDFGYGDDVADAVDIQRDGKIVMVGYGTRNLYTTADDFVFVRLRSDGSLDRSFSGDGIAIVNSSGDRHDRPASVDVQRDGRIIAVGSSAPHWSNPAPDDSDVAVMRVKADGTRDSSFSGDGVARFPVGDAGGYATGAVQHPDGRLLIVGRVYEDRQYDASDWLVMRLHPAGARDRSFGGDGIVRTNFGTGSDWAGGVAVQPSGKIIVGGSIYESQGLARYLAS